MAKQEISTVFSKIASEMHTILGPIKVLSSENPKTAGELYRRLVQSAGTLDAFVCLYLRHFCSHVMEIERLQGFKRDLLRNAYQEWVNEQIVDRQQALGVIARKSTTDGFWALVRDLNASKNTSAKEQAKGKSAAKTHQAEMQQPVEKEGSAVNDQEAQDRLEEAKQKDEELKARYEAEIEFLQAKQPTELDYAAAFTRCLPEYERIERLIMSAEARRDNALREMENWQAGLGRRIRELSDKIIDGELDEQPNLTAPSPVAAKPGAPLMVPDRTVDRPRRRAARSPSGMPVVAESEAPMAPLPLFDQRAVGTEGNQPSPAAGEPTGLSSHETDAVADSSARLDRA